MDEKLAMFAIKTWFKEYEDGSSRFHVEVNGRECASCTPEEAVAVVHILEESLAAEGYSASVFKAPGRGSGQN